MEELTKDRPYYSHVRRALENLRLADTDDILFVVATFYSTGEIGVMYKKFKTLADKLWEFNPEKKDENKTGSV